MAITKFKINNSRTEIEFKAILPPGDVVTKITMWNEDNYKNPIISGNLNSKISGISNEEEFIITLSDAILAKFNGIYFIEIESQEGVVEIKATMSFSRIKTIISTMLCGITLDCLNCNSAFQNAVLMDLYLDATHNALITGRFNDSIKYFNQMEMLQESCIDCPPSPDMGPDITP